MKHLSLGLQVLLAVVLGIFTGLFFGPLCQVLKPYGDAFTMLLQVVVLPYICFSLIHGLGSIQAAMGKKLFQCGWPFLVGLWLLMFGFLFGLGILIPKPAVVLLPSSTHTPLSQNILDYLIPQNLFYDLANNIVPAVAVFGILMGCALMHMQTKEPLCGMLERLNQAFEKILVWIAAISPIGAFVHIAYAVGTVRFEELNQLSFYVVSFILLSLFTTFWVLPWLLSALIPLSFRETSKAIRTVCLLPFVTGLSTISLPFINSFLKKLSQHEAAQEKQLHEMSQSVIPIAYSFAQIGNATIVFFFWFLSFYYRHPLVGMEKGLLSLLTLPLSVGSSATSISAVSFLIEQLNFPPDAISLFTETMAITLNFQVLMSVAAIVSLVLVVLFRYYGILQVQWSKLCGRLCVVLVVFEGLLWVASGNVHLDDKYGGLYQKLSVADVIANPVVETNISREVVANEDPLQRILRTGVLKVGYQDNNMPYCYRNDRGELVGYDVAMAHLLARDLDCKLEFVELHIDKLAEELNAGTYDIAMSAILMIEQRLGRMDFTHPYTEQNNVLLVPLKNRNKFTGLDQAAQDPNLVIGAAGGYSYVVQRHFPLAKLVHTSDMSKLEGADAWVWSRTPAFIWCLSHPDYAIVDYGSQIGKRYFAYPVREGSPDFISFMNNWLMLKEESGMSQDMVNYWVQGLPPKGQTPRWSIFRNVLGW